MPSQEVLDLLTGLKSRNVVSRKRAVRQLHHFAKTELRELPPDALARLLDEFNHHIHSMISSSDNNEKKAGILTIGKNIS